MKIKNWKKFQHFKDRRPPWIKLHREILEQRDINTISDRAFRLLVNLWVLASEDVEMLGTLPEIIDIAYNRRTTEKDIVELLQELTPWIDQSDIKVISPCQQLVPPETETYKEEAEAEIDIDFALFWQEWPQKKNKATAQKAWDKLSNEDRHQAIDAIPQHKNTKQWKDGFAPHASTFLTQRRFEDELTEADYGTGRKNSKAIGSGRGESAPQEEFTDELANFREF